MSMRICRGVIGPSSNKLEFPETYWGVIDRSAEERHVNNYVRAISEEKNKEFVKYGCVGNDLGCWEY